MRLSCAAVSIPSLQTLRVDGMRISAGTGSSSQARKTREESLQVEIRQPDAAIRFSYAAGHENAGDDRYFPKLKKKVTGSGSGIPK